MSEPPVPDADSGADSGARPSPTASRNPRRAFGWIAVGALLLAAVGVLSFTASNDGSDASETVWLGRVLDPPLPRPDITLIDLDGNPWNFATETEGTLTFLFFGYTSCPDICPITMATLNAALDELPTVGSTIVFITTDPERDSPDRIREWLRAFDTRIVGLTGTPEQLADAQRAAGQLVAVADEPDAKGKYLVGHSSAVIVFTPDDLAHLEFGSGTMQSEWMDQIPKIVGVDEWNPAPSR